MSNFREKRKINFMKFFVNKLHQFHITLRCMMHNCEKETCRLYPKITKNNLI